MEDPAGPNPTNLQALLHLLRKGSLAATKTGLIRFTNQVLAHPLHHSKKTKGKIKAGIRTLKEYRYSCRAKTNSLKKSIRVRMPSIFHLGRKITRRCLSRWPGSRNDKSLHLNSTMSLTQIQKTKRV